MKKLGSAKFLYNFNPSPYNYLKFKLYHFLKREDTAFTSSLYRGNLVNEVNNDIAKQAPVNKKTLTLALIKKILENEGAKQELVDVFDKPAALDEEIKQFLKRVNDLMQELPDEKEQSTTKEEPVLVADFPKRTYVVFRNKQ